jgi:hypothetical protein
VADRGPLLGAVRDSIGLRKENSKHKFLLSSVERFSSKNLWKDITL